MFHNIERSAFKPGQYVGYAQGPWRIAKSFGMWRAVKREGLFYLEGRTLGDISKALDYFAEHGKEPPRHLNEAVKYRFASSRSNSLGE